MANSYSLSFQALTDDNIWFANAAAFNNWVSALRVEIPDAAVGTPGLAEKADIADYTAVTVSGTFMTILSDQDGDGIDEEYKAFSKEAAEDLITKFNALSAQVAAITAALRA